MQQMNRQENYHGTNHTGGRERNKNSGNFYRHSSGESGENDLLREIFPCSSPTTPGMSNYEDRLSSYANWPRGVLKATPEELAGAGFMYLGERDRVKCFYCNGGLQHWAYDEDPWYEHAKWYPNCEFLLRKKGMDFVEQIASRFPQLKRPTMASSSSRSPVSPPDLSPTRQINQDTTNLSQYRPSSSLAHLKTNPLEEAMKGEIPREAIGIGFEESLVRKLVKTKLERENAKYTTLISLVEELQREEERMEASPSSSHSSYSSSSSSYSSGSASSQMSLSGEDLPAGDVYSTSNEPTMRWDAPAQVQCHQPNTNRCSLEKVFPPRVPLPRAVLADDTQTSHGMQTHPCDPQAAKEKLRSIREEQTCKVCLDRKIDCLFRPCNHLCCCVDCSAALRNCPICRKKIDFIMKIYRK